MDKEDKRGIFFGVIGVLTLIVAIIGASLAYFSVNARSSENAVTVQAATVKIVYKEGDALNVSNIIPATKTVAFETYRRYLAEKTHQVVIDEENNTKQDIPYEKCKDDNGRTVCGVYEFEVTNSGEETVNITAKVIPTALADNQNGFTNLKYALYDVTNVTDTKTEYGTEVTTGTVKYTEFSLITDPAPVANGSTVKYRLFVWLNDTGLEQDEEQGAMFKGTIYVNVPEYGDNITGNANETLGQ